jgi:hypothetical protein
MIRPPDNQIQNPLSVSRGPETLSAPIWSGTK